MTTSAGLTIEVLVTTYNNPDYARLCLEGLSRQTDRSFTIAMADDGSGPEMGRLVREFRGRELDIRHVWHEDRGFRRARILNKALAGSRADYVIFTDGDCIAGADFIGDHRRVARAGRFVAGRRVNLGPEITTKLLSSAKGIDWISPRGRLIYWSVVKRIRNPEFALGLPWLLSDLWSKKRVGLLGANMALSMGDLREVNGFDSEYDSYGGEDTDLEWRLLRHGVEKRALLGGGAVFHLYHERRGSNRQSLELLREKRARGAVQVVHGIEDPAPAE